ncbi:hypothetical protein FIBSPDRAFT_917855 [Athelia psychrophila]|uniref:UBX domain-containing protein n=1 Tax=Athelia psychrophila TaxID=1759441 RepID=A0A166QYV7_9AGAM|nr:hypothetical protein FIBSPDRAFT_917855 [Fibularhizoctonia sp. CBS 109695]
MDSLSETQQHAVSTLQAISNCDTEAAIALLESSNWDVQAAASLIFDAAPTAGPSISPRSPSPRRRIENLEIDDSHQGALRDNRRARDSNRARRVSLTSSAPLFRADLHPHVQSYGIARYLPTCPNSLVSILAFPLHLLSSIFRFIFGVLRIPIPQIRFSGLNFYRPLPSGPSDPRSVSDRWVRALEDETGAVCYSRAGTQIVGASSATDAGPSSLTARAGAGVNGEPFEEGMKRLPDFTLASYEDVLRICQRDTKIACVILVSDEHDDVAEFKRSTLTNPAFVQLLHDNEIIVWGGDVREKDAWSAAQKLQATTYPFVAFLALQPRRGSRAPSTSSSPPTLTVLSRHQGRSVPATAPTSAETLSNHLSSQLLPRVTPFLERLRNAARERERDRTLREEQDRAFQDTARRDRERIEAKIAQSERENLEAARRVEDARQTEQRQEQERLESERLAVIRMEWRRWARKSLVTPEAAKGTPGAIRIAVRLPDGDGRTIRQFAPSDSLTGLYAYVDSQLIPSHFPASADPSAPPLGTPIDEESLVRQSIGATEWWGFRLFLAYPRKELAWKSHTRLVDIAELKGGAQIVVERGGSHSSSRATSPNGGEDDDYDTESD